MSIKRTEPDSIRVLAKGEAIGAYAHPTRMAILSILAGEPATLSMVAKRLETRPANLSHHFRKLAAAGLIVLVETRTTSRNVEKFYRATAYGYVVEPRGMSAKDKGALALSLFREELSAAISRAGASEEALVLMSTARIASSRRKAFRRRLEKLIQDFGEKEGTDGELYTLGLALFSAGPSAKGAGKVRL